jgi:hypothetical protein
MNPSLLFGIFLALLVPINIGLGLLDIVNGRKQFEWVTNIGFALFVAPISYLWIKQGKKNA